MIRTSISLPREIYEKLEKASLIHRTSKGKLALRGLKRMRGNQKKNKIVRRSTVAYNSAHCDSRLYLWLDEDMHNYVQALRFYEKISVSRLFSQAINNYLKTILVLLHRKAKQLITKIDTSCSRVHRRLSFAHRRLVSMRIVMLNSA